MIQHYLSLGKSHSNQPYDINIYPICHRQRFNDTAIICLMVSHTVINHMMLIYVQYVTGKDPVIQHYLSLGKSHSIQPYDANIGPICYRQRYNDTA